MYAYLFALDTKLDRSITYTSLDDPLILAMTIKKDVNSRYFIEIKSYRQNFWTVHQSAPAGLLFGRDVPICEFYYQFFFRVLPSRGVADPSHE